MLLEEREALRKTLPGIAQLLAQSDLLTLEGAGANAISGWFREHGAPHLLVPKSLGGSGRSLLDLALLMRAVAADCPSLGIMMLMHQHTLAALCFDEIPLGCLKKFLTRVAESRMLVASAFAEARKGADLLDSSVTCVPRGDHFVVNGCKKPCTMSQFADFFLVGVSHGSQPDRRGLALVPQDHASVKVESFWNRDVFRSTGSECVRFDAAVVPADHVLLPTGSGTGAIKQQFAVTQSEVTLSTVFQLLMPCAYLGMASRLYEVCEAVARPADTKYLHLACDIEAASLAQYQLAERLGKGNFSATLLGQAMAMSYNAVKRIDGLVEALSAIPGLMGHSEARYLIEACRCVHFHPPSNLVREQILANCYRPS